MRILYHHRIFSEDGQSVHVRAMQRAFAAEGNEVFEAGLVPKGHASPPPAAAPGRRWSDLVWRTVRQGHPAARELAEYAYTPAALLWLLRSARHTRAQLIYERYSYANAAGVLAARRAGIPLVLEVNAPLLAELERTRGVLLRRPGRRLERFIWRAPARVCAVSRTLAQLVAQAGVLPERILVTPNGVDLECYPERERSAARALAHEALGLPPSARREDAVVLGFVGYMRSWHRLDLAINALGRIAAANVHLVVVGGGFGSLGLRKLVASLALGERVHFRESLEHEMIPALLPAFDVGLLPGVTSYSSPLKLPEYLAAGLAVLAPDQPNVREIVSPGRDGWLFAPGDAEALAAGLQPLVASAGLRRSLGERGRRTVIERDLTWRANARKVLQAISSPSG